MLPSLTSHSPNTPTISAALAISDSALVVGRSNFQSVLWQGDEIVPISPMPGEATGVNNNGLVVGHIWTLQAPPLHSSPPLPSLRAFIWQLGELHELPHLRGATIAGLRRSIAPGKWPGFHSGQVEQVERLSGATTSQNNWMGLVSPMRSTIEERSQDRLPSEEPFTPPCGVTQLMDLGTLGGDMSFALGINNQGEVIGGASTPSGVLHAFRIAPWILSVAIPAFLVAETRLRLPSLERVPEWHAPAANQKQPPVKYNKRCRKACALMMGVGAAFVSAGSYYIAVKERPKQWWPPVLRSGTTRPCGVGATAVGVAFIVEGFLSRK